MARVDRQGPKDQNYGVQWISNFQGWRGGRGEGQKVVAYIPYRLEDCKEHQCKGKPWRALEGFSECDKTA